MPTGGGGDAAPADSGADASVRPAGRPARTRLMCWLNLVLFTSQVWQREDPDSEASFYEGKNLHIVQGGEQEEYKYTKMLSRTER